MKTVSDRSPLAYFLVAFVAMAGLAYINFMPGVVAALAGGIGFTEAEAGQLVAANGYGGIVGSTVAIFLVRRLSWRPTMLASLAALVLIEWGTPQIQSYEMMLASRGLSGFVGGLSVGVAFSVLARLQNPDRAFGTLLFVQFVIGSLVIYLLPGLEQAVAASAVFYVTAAIAGIALVFVPFLPNLAFVTDSPQTTGKLSGRSRGATLLMLGIFAYQCGASAVWAYVGLIGQAAGMPADSVSTYIATTGMLGLAGALLPIFGSKGVARWTWVVTGVVLSVISAALLNLATMPALFVAAMALLFFSWPAIQSYLLAVTADMDPSGQLSTTASVVASVGLATGPLLGSALLNGGNFLPMLFAVIVLFLCSAIVLAQPVKLYNYPR